MRGSDEPTESVVVHLAGELDIAVAEAVVSQLVDAACGGRYAVIADLAGVTFLDSSGVEALLRSRSAVDLWLRNVPSNVERILHLVGLGEHFARAGDRGPRLPPAS